MTTVYRNLTTACVAAVLAFGLAACGGGSSTTPDTTTPMPDPAIAERTAINNAITAANTAVGMVTDDADDATVTAADTAVAAATKAITDAANVPAEEKAAHTRTVSGITATLTAAKASRTTAMKAAADKRQMEMAAAGKALQGALTDNPLSLLAAPTADTITATGTLDLAAGTATGAVNPPPLEAGDSAGALGDWKGTHYADVAADGVTNAAVVYTNQADPKMTDVTTHYATAANRPASATGYADATRTVSLGATADDGIAGSMFPTTGTRTFEPTAPGGEDVSFSGMYHGLSGTYVCNTGGTDNACQATYTANGISLVAGGTWTFKHAAGAMVPVADADYLYFGWWLRKDEDDVPTAASAFYGVEGAAPAVLSGVPSIEGSATYAGKAAGKFAINNPLGGSNAGHFTADATLTAKFGGTGPGVTGTIDNFMANDESVPWSVALNNNTLVGDTDGAAAATNISDAGAITSVATDYTTATPGVDDTKTTVWSIDGNAAPASGTWSGQMYDLAADDGSNVPTTILGTFQSMFGSTHTMVGAFGADTE